MKQTSMPAVLTRVYKHFRLVRAGLSLFSLCIAVFVCGCSSRLLQIELPEAREHLPVVWLRDGDNLVIDNAWIVNITSAARRRVSPELSHFSLKPSPFSDDLLVWDKENDRFRIATFKGQGQDWVYTEAVFPDDDCFVNAVGWFSEKEIFVARCGYQDKPHSRLLYHTEKQTWRVFDSPLEGGFAYIMDMMASGKEFYAVHSTAEGMQAINFYKRDRGGLLHPIKALNTLAWCPWEPPLFTFGKQGADIYFASRSDPTEKTRPATLDGFCTDHYNLYAWTPLSGIRLLRSHLQKPVYISPSGSAYATAAGKKVAIFKLDGCGWGKKGTIRLE